MLIPVTGTPPCSPPVRPRTAGPSHPVVVGHRGAPVEAPENTLAAFLAAWRAGADWVEADVQPTADGVPVLLHDDTVDRTTDGTGPVRELPWSVVRELTVGGAPAAVPRLRDLLTAVTGPRRLLLEIKGRHTDADLRRLLTELSASGADERVFLQSFEPDELRRLRRLAPDRPFGLLVEGLGAADLAAADALGATAVNPSVPAALAAPGVVHRLRGGGRSVAVWTADDPATWTALADLGVDAVITDRPGDLIAHWAKRS